MWTKRGFDANQMFIYILSVIVLGLVIMIAFDAIKSFNAAADDIVFTTMLGDIKTNIIEVARQTRSERTIPISLNDKYSHICILAENLAAPPDPDDVSATECSINGGYLTPLACSVLQTQDIAGSGEQYLQPNLVIFDNYQRIAYLKHIDGLTVANNQPFSCSVPGDTSVRLKMRGINRAAEAEFI